MSNIPTNPAALLQTLSQITSVSGVQTSVSTASNVIVNQLSNTLISLGNIRNNITLPAEKLNGKLESGKLYQATVESRGTSAQINFYPNEVNFSQQLSRLESETLIGQLPTLLSRQHIDDILQIQAKATSVRSNSITLNINGKDITFDLNNANQRFKSGQTLSLTLKTSPQGWLLSLSAPNESNSATLISINTRQALSILSSRPDTAFQLPQSTINQVRNSSLKESANIVRAANSEANGKNVTVQINNKGIVQLSANPVPIATLPVEKSNIATLNKIDLSTASTNSKTDNSNATRATTSNTQSAVSITSPTKEHDVDTSLSTSLNRNIETKLSSLTSNLGLTAQVQQSIQSLIRQTQPIQDSPSRALAQIEALLSESQIQQDPALKSEITKLKAQIQLLAPNSLSQEGESSIRQLIGTSPVTVTPQQATTPPVSNHFLSGIVSLIQLSLSAKLANQSPTNIDKLSQILAPIFSSVSTSVGATSTSKGALAKRLSDWFQLEQKHQGLQAMSKLMASHQNNKLAGIEQQLEGMETLYYVLPLGSGEQRTDAELLIRREPESARQDKNTAERRSWQLTMKLDIGDKGQLLSKARLTEEEVELDFYGSNQQLVDLVLNFLPYLKQRLESLGIIITKKSCQLGKIPPHLYQRPYQILETRV